jgi:hypothetical protein
MNRRQRKALASGRVPRYVWLSERRKERYRRRFVARHGTPWVFQGETFVPDVLAHQAILDMQGRIIRAATNVGGST